MLCYVMLCYVMLCYRLCSLSVRNGSFIQNLDDRRTSQFW